MILVSGFNVYPNEIEDVVARHPGVLEVAAIGVPDEHSGEVPKLFVVRKDPDLTAETLIAYCRENLTGYKRPSYIEFRTELPKTHGRQDPAAGTEGIRRTPSDHPAAAVERLSTAAVFSAAFLASPSSPHLLQR